MFLKRSQILLGGLAFLSAAAGAAAQIAPLSPTVPATPAARSGQADLLKSAPMAIPVAPAKQTPSPPVEYDPTNRDAPKLPPLLPSTTGTRALLWEVKSIDGLNTVFLFGTIHVGKSSFYPLPDVVEKAFQRSAKLVVEANITDQKDAAEIARLIDYPKGETIEKHLPPALVARLKTQLAKHKIPFANIATMRPVMLGGLLPIVEFVQLGYEMNQGLDLKLTQRALAEKKPIVELESSLAQIQLMTGMSMPLQEAFLENAIVMSEQGRTSDQVTGIVNAWQLGDPKLLVEISDEAARSGRLVRELNTILLDQRHPAMLTKIEGYIASGLTHFIAVGALHLVGKDGLIESLKARGFLVRQL